MSSRSSSNARERVFEVDLCRGCLVEDGGRRAGWLTWWLGPDSYR